MKKYKRDLVAIAKAKNLGEIYQLFGINLETDITDIRQIHANDSTIGAMQTLIENAWQKKYKAMGKQYMDYSIAVHMLELSPKCDNDVPDDELWVFEDGEKY